MRLIAALIAAYGIYAFIEHQVGLYMFNLIQFAYFDYEQSALIFFAEYLAIMGLFVIVFYYLGAVLQMQAQKTIQSKRKVIKLYTGIFRV